ncbi:MAG: sugar nucleotide-binding protein, partial [Pseudomonadales bacterium]|nr:sugar nucleotide-binding protein [Pseudomonadales bacterium]
MRILVLGGDGMLGHTLLKYLGRNHEVRCTLRRSLKVYKEFKIFTSNNSYTDINVSSLDRLAEVLANFRPEVVVNCVGIVKQLAIAKESIPSLEINALLPHKLSVLCKEIDARLIHIST